MQVSAEYVVNALRRIRADSGRKVAMIGHSQGVTVPRWALKWWPSARDAVDDFVMEAGRSEEHTSDLQSLLRTSYAVFCSLKHKVIHEDRIQNKYQQYHN